MSQSSAHITSIVITPPMLKQQIIIRLNTLVGKVGGSYYPEDQKGNSTPLGEIEGMEVYGIETKGRDVYLMTIPTDEDAQLNMEDDYIPYNATEFYIEQLWDLYLACEPIYQSRLVDYGSLQE